MSTALDYAIVVPEREDGLVSGPTRATTENRGNIHIFGDDKMTEKFKKPHFNDRGIEVRLEGDEVALYLNEDGLKKIRAVLDRISASNQSEHIHLSDFEVLTHDSLKLVIASIR
jgi:hypothetical protein